MPPVLHISDLGGACGRDLELRIVLGEVLSPSGPLEVTVKVSTLLSMKGHNVVTVQPSDTVAAAAKILGENRFGVLVVSTDGVTIAGIISERDIVRELGVSGADLLGKQVSDIMTRTVRTCNKGDTVERLMEIMTEHRIRHLPVTEDGKMIGLISIGDIVKVRVRQLEHEADQLERYISNTW